MIILIETKNDQRNMKIQQIKWTRKKELLIYIKQRINSALKFALAFVKWINHSSFYVQYVTAALNICNIHSLLHHFHIFQRNILSNNWLDQTFYKLKSAFVLFLLLSLMHIKINRKCSISMAKHIKFLILISKLNTRTNAATKKANARIE